MQWNNEDTCNEEFTFYVFVILPYSCREAHFILFMRRKNKQIPILCSNVLHFLLKTKCKLWNSVDRTGWFQQLMVTPMCVNSGEFCYALILYYLNTIACIKPVNVIPNSIPLGSYLGCIWLQASTECEGIKLCASSGCVEPLPGHWVQCCTNGGHEQWWVEKNYLCWRQWRNTSM